MFVIEHDKGVCEKESTEHVAASHADIAARCGQRWVVGRPTGLLHAAPVQHCPWASTIHASSSNSAQTLHAIDPLFNNSIFQPAIHCVFSF